MNSLHIISMYGNNATNYMIFKNEFTDIQHYIFHEMKFEKIQFRSWKWWTFYSVTRTARFKHNAPVQDKNAHAYISQISWRIKWFIKGLRKMAKHQQTNIVFHVKRIIYDGVFIEKPFINITRMRTHDIKMPACSYSKTKSWP